MLAKTCLRRKHGCKCRGEAHLERGVRGTGLSEHEEHRVSRSLGIGCVNAPSGPARAEGGHSNSKRLHRGLIARHARHRHDVYARRRCFIPCSATG